MSLEIDNYMYVIIHMKDMPVHKAVIIGSGPAGCMSAVYCARASLQPLLLRGPNPGGQLVNTGDVENFPGFTSINGYELTKQMEEQAQHSDCQIEDYTVIKADFSKTPYELYVTDGVKEDVIQTETVIIATGSTPKKLGVPGEDKFWSKGVSTCAVCDGFFYKNKVVAVVGGSDTAFEESSYLSRIASKVYLIHRSDKFRASKIMQKRVFENPKIEIVKFATVKEICGEEKVNKIVLQTPEGILEKEVNGVFIAIGHTPQTEIFSKAGVKVDDHGYFVSDNGKTNFPGIFTAGDCQDPIYRQAVTSAGSGCIAALELERYLSSK